MEVPSGTARAPQAGPATHHGWAAFGGAKGSGYGVEFGIDGLKAVTQPKVVSLKK